MPAFVVSLVGRLLATRPDAFLFAGRQNHTEHRQRSYHGFRRRFTLAAAAVALVSSPVRPAGRRHTGAGWRTPTAACRLRHANASVTTRHYARPVDGRDAEVAKTWTSGEVPGPSNGHG